MTTEPQRRYSHLTLIEVILGVLLLSVAAFFTSCATQQAHHREEVRLLRVALDKGDASAVFTLVKSNPRLSTTKNADGLTPLHIAAWRGDKDLAELLLAQGAKVNTKANDGVTPLHYAAEIGPKEFVELLLVKGADVNVKANNGGAPLHYAVAAVRIDIVELLLTKGADVNAKTSTGQTSLHIAIKNGHQETIELLRAHGAKE